MSDRNFYKEAQAEDAGRAAYRQWIASRIENIHRIVTAHDVLRRNGVDLKYSDRHEQFSCPFHGRDNKPSARVYGETARGPSHVWCFVCQERWDAISLWRKFNNLDGKFTAVLRDIEQVYGIDVPESPLDHYAEYEGVPEDYILSEVRDLLNTCDNRLKNARSAFDFTSFSKLSVALDRVKYQVDEKKLPLDKAKEVLTSILDKVGARVRACPDG